MTLRTRAVALLAAVVAVTFCLGVAAGAAVGHRSVPDMASSGMVPGPSAVDIGFLQDMAVHHDQAVLMARIARSRTTDPAIATLASAVQESQLIEIGHMRGVLRMWGASELPSGQPMRWMATDHRGGHGHGMGHGDPATLTVMPGMATETELTALREASGASLDVLFLQLMLRHHEGGLPMLAAAAEQAAVPAVRDLARQMRFHQTEETATLLSGLRMRGAGPLGA